jgi:UDP-2,3-diacylglucosamine pyrophosphatase LpxH
MRYSLRNQYKIKEKLGEEFLKYLLLSLNNHFNINLEIIEYQYDNEKYKVIHVDNVQPKTDSYYELFVIKKTYDVYNLAYKSSVN